ncbi:MAG: biopolymer transporter ExbD [Phycisphaeraceae bacterium]|nr:biopolymer transporter ExbD [Phycisphaeraceae bacterium]
MNAGSQVNDPHIRAGQMRRPRRWSGPADVRLNVTAMLDVMFQLLIFFVVTAGVMLEEGMLSTRLLPQHTGAMGDAVLPRQPLRIVVEARDVAGYALRIEHQEQQPADFRALCQALEELQWDPARKRSGAYKPDHPLLIEPGAKVRWQHVVNAFNAAVKAGYTDVSFSPPPPPAGP